MKKHTIIILTITLLALSSCLKPVREEENVTPEVFQEHDFIEEVSSYKRGYSSVTEQLYNELLEKDEELKQIEEKIKKLSDDNYKNNIEINKFLSNNSIYYSEVKSYAKTIQDSILRNEIISKINLSEEDYKNKTADIKALKDILNKKITDLNDYKTALKIVLTDKSIKSYQDNYEQDTTSISKLINRYNNIIKNITKKL